MKPISILSRVCVILLFKSAQGRAASEPSFSLDHLVRTAKHIVLATEGDTIDGKITVLASYKGNLHPGSEITVPLLAQLSDSKQRVIMPRLLFQKHGKPLHSEVTCKTMLLFLDGDGNDLHPPYFPEYFTWLCWLEGDRVYARIQEMNPGTSTELKDLGVTTAFLLTEITKKEQNKSRLSNRP